MTLREKVGQLFMIGFSGLEIPANVIHFIEKYNIGFIILFSRNIDSAVQVIELTNHIHQLGRLSPFIFTDQEGGTVVQFKELAATIISPMGIASTQSPRYAQKAGNIVAQEMNEYGIDGILAPVLDVNTNIDNPIIGIRAYSDEAETVIKFATPFMKALQKNKIAACGKHFPGHGGTQSDSHHEIPQVQLKMDELSNIHIKPFYHMIKNNIDAIMTTHTIYPNIATEIATFSPYFLTDLLKVQMGFKGIVMSDCLEMNAVKKNFNPLMIAEYGMNAGLDVFTISHNIDFQMEVIEKLIFLVHKGIISEGRIDESFRKILQLKNRYGLHGQKKRKFRSRKETKIRPHRQMELKIAQRSITILRNNHHLIPLAKNKKIIIFEWEKVLATNLISSAQNLSYLYPIAKKYFPQIDLIICPLTSSWQDDWTHKIKEHDYVIAGLFSRNKEIATCQAGYLGKILTLQPQTIVISMGNPFDIIFSPEIHTYVLTYGFRQVQLEALFKILTGQTIAQGKIPVAIPSLFNRWDGISE